MKIRLTEAQWWLAQTSTTLPDNSAQVIAAILAEHRAFMASVERNQETKPAQRDTQTGKQIAQTTSRCIRRAIARLKGESVPVLESVSPDRRVGLKESIQ